MNEEATTEVVEAAAEGVRVRVARRTYRGEARLVASVLDVARDALGRPKTVYRFGRTEGEARARLGDAMRRRP